jgi:uncharacterized tellurite resistance protein B-like protein
MKTLLAKLFFPDSTNADDKTQIGVDLATAILLIEVAEADFQNDASEAELIRRLLLDHLELDESQLDELLANARREADRLVSLQHLTRMMNEGMDQQGKLRVIELMWQVAYADGEKHHYEEHLLRQVADLLYVPHADFIQARHKAEETHCEPGPV